MTRAAALALVLLPLVGCRKADPAAATAQASDAEAPLEAAAPLPPVAPARCRPTPQGLVLDDGKGLDDLEIGDTLGTPAGTMVDLVHRTTAGRVAALAWVPADAASVRVRDLGPTLGDAPPPRVAARGDGFVAAAYGVSKRTDARELVLYAVTANGDAKPTGTVAEQRDDSLAFDVSPSLVAWDEATTGASPRGVIRVAEILPEGKAGAPHDASPAESDAEAPRLVPSSAGAFVFWIARRPEALAPLDGSAPEVTGEAPSNAWLEVAMVDPHGAPVGPARRLTSAAGQVSGYDVQAVARQGAKAEVLVAVRDEGEAVDGSGGALLRVRVREDGAEPAVAFPTDGLGRGAPGIVESSPPWLAWVGPREETRLLPLDPAGVPLARPSAEAALDDGRPLALLDHGQKLLVAMPADPAAQLRVFACGGP